VPLITARGPIDINAEANRPRAMMFQCPLESTPKRCAANNRRSFHDDKAGALKILHKAFGDNLGHDLVGVVHALRPGIAAHKAMASARSRGSAGVSLSTESGIAG